PAVPLKSVEVDVQVQGHVATVSSSLLYLNQEERPMEAVFVFPLPAECALCHFSAKLGDVEVVAKLQDKQRALEEYDDALSSGKPAFLLEEKEQGSNVFQLTVGSLPPGQSAAITLVYISELAMQADDALRFCLPTVFNPLYTPQASHTTVTPMKQLLCASFIPCHFVSSFSDMDQSPMVATITSMPVDGVPYTLAVRAQVSSPQRISKVESNCSLEPLEYLNSDQTEAKVSLSSGYKFDRDVELLFYYQDAHKSTAIVEAGQESAEPGNAVLKDNFCSLMRDPVVMLSCYPELPASETGEFIFVMVRSCSMDSKMHSGKDAKKRIDSAKDTLLLLLKSLPMGCYFNIYGFGTNFEHIFPKSVEYNQETLDEALAKVKGMRANMGGTEILPPMEHIYSLPCVPNHPRQLFIFTDGEVGIGNTKVALNLVKADVNPTRCFSFGIGEGASTAFITGVAKEGSGHAQFITGKDRMQPKVMQSLRYALHPTAKDISVDWNLPDGVSVSTLSPLPTFLFHGHRALLYAQLKGEVSKKKKNYKTFYLKVPFKTLKATAQSEAIIKQDA
ncbi:von Willebrand factor A domain-containing protein 5A-like, partial [Engraulis encrasicolus]|uniref:von Willebrand factor A domain-containing protein 5A-like n=1 Tax=Engraulis encrasicolus TaxID=184585 RepID=UPI002FD6D886